MKLNFVASLLGSHSCRGWGLFYIRRHHSTDTGLGALALLGWRRKRAALYTTVVHKIELSWVIDGGTMTTLMTIGAVYAVLCASVSAILVIGGWRADASTE